jgi:hypothetical protein
MLVMGMRRMLRLGQLAILAFVNMLDQFGPFTSIPSGLALLHIFLTARPSEHCPIRAINIYEKLHSQGASFGDKRHPHCAFQCFLLISDTSLESNAV